LNADEIIILLKLKVINPSSKLIIKESVAALAGLINKSHLKELINDLEHEFFSVEVVILLTHRLVDVIEMHTPPARTRRLHLAGNKLLELVFLITDLDRVALDLVPNQV
jgi:hypothetical protein